MEYESVAFQTSNTIVVNSSKILDPWKQDMSSSTATAPIELYNIFLHLCSELSKGSININDTTYVYTPASEHV